MFALVDCNNFYVSCERIFNPALNGRPVVVLSNNDGCIVARSEEAKRLGIKMGEPAFKIAALLEQQKVAVFSSNYPLYQEISLRVMATLGRFTPELEIYSIDEAFLGLGGLAEPGADWARTVHRTVLKELGVPVSVGVGPTKGLAKAANHFAKLRPECRGVCLLVETGTITAALRELAIGEVWGIGRQHRRFLESHQIRTAWDLTQASDSWVRKHLTVVGLRTKKELEGVSCLPLTAVAPKKQMICVARSFGQPQTELGQLREAVATFTAKCARKLRRQGSCAGAIQVFIHTNGFNPREPQYSKNCFARLPVATDGDPELVRYALRALETIYRPGYCYKKAGVVLTEIVPGSCIQGALFDTVDRERQAGLMRTLDSINARYGPCTIKLAVQGSGRRWKLRQERLSPCYTTRWSEIITVRS